MIGEVVFPTIPTARVIAAFGAYNAQLWVGGYHMGVDLTASKHPPVYAAADGVVVEAGYYRTGTTAPYPGGYGRHVIIQHEGFKTVYGHLWGSGPDADVPTKAFDEVKAGDVIGHMGGDMSDSFRGVSGGPHLHFEVVLPEEPKAVRSIKTPRGWCVDPLTYLAEHFLPAPLYVAKVKTADGLNVRSEPSTEKTSGILYALIKDQVVDVAEEKDGWARLAALRPEWVSTKYLERVKPARDPGTASPPPPTPAPVPSDTAEAVKAARLEEIDHLIEMLEVHRLEIEKGP